MARLSPVIDRPAIARLGARSAFTLIECLIASVVLATCVVCVSGALIGASSQNQQMDVQARALSEARALMEEIAARPFDRPADADPAVTLICLSDYHGITRTATAGAHPTVIADSISYSSTASIEFRSTPNGLAVVNGDLALITVTTTPSASGAAVVLHRMVPRYTQVRG